MPRGPKGEKRPADGIGNAVKVVRIATGEEFDAPAIDDGKNKLHRSLDEQVNGDTTAPALLPFGRASL